MKLASTVVRSLQAGMHTELRDLERAAAAAGVKDAAGA